MGHLLIFCEIELRGEIFRNISNSHSALRSMAVEHPGLALACWRSWLAWGKGSSWWQAKQKSDECWCSFGVSLKNMDLTSVQPGKLSPYGKNDLVLTWKFSECLSVFCIKVWLVKQRYISLVGLLWIIVVACFWKKQGEGLQVGMKRLWEEIFLIEVSLRWILSYPTEKAAGCCRIHQLHWLSYAKSWGWGRVSLSCYLWSPSCPGEELMTDLFSMANFLVTGAYLFHFKFLLALCSLCLSVTVSLG